MNFNLFLLHFSIFFLPFVSLSSFKQKMIAISSLPNFQNMLAKNPTLSPSLRVKHSFDNLIAYTAYHVKTLLECSKERHYYQQKLLPALPIFIRHIFYHCKLTPTILVVALIYLRRLKSGLPKKSTGGMYKYSIYYQQLWIINHLLDIHRI